MDLKLASLVLSVVEHFSKRLQMVLGMLEGCVKRVDEAASPGCPKIGFVLPKRSKALAPVIFIINIIYLRG